MEVKAAVCCRGGRLRPDRQLRSLGPQLTLPAPLSPPQSPLERPSPAGQPPSLGGGTPCGGWPLGSSPPLRRAPCGGGGPGCGRKTLPHSPSVVCHFPGRGDKTKQGTRGRKVEGRGHSARGGSDGQVEVGVGSAGSWGACRDRRQLKLTSARPVQVADSSASPLRHPWRVPASLRGARSPSGPVSPRKCPASAACLPSRPGLPAATAARLRQCL